MQTGEREEMTAKEIHELYSPLLKRIPDVKPMCEFRAGETSKSGYVVPDEWNVVPKHRISGEGRDDPYNWDGCSPDVAAALCRVAVEDWLSYKCTLSVVRRSDGWRAYTDCDDGQEPARETVHHALVGAAHEIADALGIP